MLETAKHGFAPVAVLRCGKVDKSKVKQKKDSYRAWFENYLKTVQYGLAIMIFRCCGTSNLEITGKPPKDAEPICGIPASVIYEACTKFGWVTANDIEAEFLANVTAPDATANCATLYFGVLDGLLQYPKLKSTDENKILDDSEYLQSLIKAGCISDWDAYLFVRDIVRLAEAFTLSVNAICGVKRKYIGYSVGKPQQDADVEAKSSTRQWTDGLRAYFNKPEERLAMLVGRSDDDIVKVLRAWAQERVEKDGRPIFRTTPSSDKCGFANAMEKNGLIHSAANTFRRKI